MKPKECPFCGAELRYVQTFNKEEFWLHANNSCILDYLVVMPYAIEKWNQRVPPVMAPDNLFEVKEEFKNEMNAIREYYKNDPEGFHSRADKLMCDLLRANGFGAGVDIFEKTKKWYS